MGLFGKSSKELRNDAAAALNAGKKALSEGRLDQAIQLYSQAIRAARKAGRNCDDVRYLALDKSAAVEITRRNFDIADQYVRDAERIVEENNWQGCIQ
jgi:tetratricopeptide (TPR) repeat protein